MVSATFQQEVERRVAQTFERRVRRAPKELVRRLIDETYVRNELWTFTDYALLAIDHPKKLAAHRERNRRFGHPFPAFITTRRDEQSWIGIPDGTRDVGFEDLGVQPLPSGGSFFFLGRDTTAYFKNLTVIWEGHGLPNDRYTIGLAYVIGFGSLITEDDYDDALDELIAFHLYGLAP